MNRLASLLIALIIAVPVSQGIRAETIYDNLGESSADFDKLVAYGPIYNSFSTGSGTNLFLTNVKLLLNTSHDDSSQAILWLCSDIGGSPDAQLTALGGLDGSQWRGHSMEWDFPVYSPFPLESNTRYWIELTFQKYRPLAVLGWYFSDSNSGIGVAGEYWSNVSGTESNSINPRPYQMSVTVETFAVPEIDPNSLGSVLALVVGSLALLERRRLKAA